MVQKPPRVNVGVVILNVEPENCVVLAETRRNCLELSFIESVPWNIYVQKTFVFYQHLRKGHTAARSLAAQIIVRNIENFKEVVYL